MDDKISFGNFTSSIRERAGKRVTGSILLVALEIVILFVPPGHPLLARFLPWLIAVVALALVVSGVFDAWRDAKRDAVRLKRERDALAERLRPVLQLGEILPPMPEDTLQYHRVMVRNGGGSTIDDVACQIASFDPEPDSLRERGSIPLVARGRFDIHTHHPTVTLNPFGEQAFDLVQHGEGEKFIRVLTPVPTLPRQLPMATYRIAVHAEGRDVKDETRWYWIRPSGRGIIVEPDE